MKCLVSVIKVKRYKSAEYASRKMQHCAVTHLPQLPNSDDNHGGCAFVFCNFRRRCDTQTSQIVEGWGEREDEERDWTVDKGRALHTVSDEAAEVTAYDAMPCWTLALIELFIHPPLAMRSHHKD